MSLYLFLFSWTALTFTFEKMPGATNAAVTAGDAAQFKCTPLSQGIFVNEKGEIWKGKKKVGNSFSDFASGSYIEYLECFVEKNELIAVYKESNGEDSIISIRRRGLAEKNAKWKLSILASTLEPPTYSHPLLKVKAGGDVFEIDVEKGVVLKTDSPGCIIVSRWPTLGEKHQRMGAGCKK